MLVLPTEAPRRRQTQGPARKGIFLTTGESLQVTNDAFAATVTAGLKPSKVSGLANNKVAALHMKNAIDPAWCDQVSERFSQHPETQREGVSPPIYSLGSHLYSCPSGALKSKYFCDAEKRNAAISAVLPGGYDPIVSFLQEACALNNAQFEYLSLNDASVRHGSIRLWGGGSHATSRGGRCYFAVPHEDYEETNADHAILEQIHDSNNVYSIIVCIDAVQGKEPETIVWDKRMSLEEIRDPDNRHPWASYGYNESLLKGIDAMSFCLQKGDMAIIPAHKVHAVIGFPGFRRCTYMAFFHLVKDSTTGFSKIIFRT